MMASNPITKVTPKSILALDRAAEFRSEFLDGEIIAMSGGSMRHSRLPAILSDSSIWPAGTPANFWLRLRVRVVPSHVRISRPHRRVWKADAGRRPPGYSGESHGNLRSSFALHRALRSRREVSALPGIESLRITSWWLRIKSASSNTRAATPTPGPSVIIRHAKH
jgi:hypothetical protein